MRVFKVDASMRVARETEPKLLFALDCQPVRGQTKIKYCSTRFPIVRLKMDYIWVKLRIHRLGVVVRSDTKCMKIIRIGVQ